jgi:hypothetical protein
MAEKRKWPQTLTMPHINSRQDIDLNVQGKMIKGDLQNISKTDFSQAGQGCGVAHWYSTLYKALGSVRNCHKKKTEKRTIAIKGIGIKMKNFPSSKDTIIEDEASD